MKMPPLFRLGKQAFDLWNDAKAPTLGAALAYYTAFSMAPLLVIVLAVAGFVFGPEAARGELAGEIGDTVGRPVADALQEVLKKAAVTGSGPLAITVSVVILLFGASGIFVELQAALNAIWGVQPKPGSGILTFIRERFLSFAMVLTTCFLLLVSMVVTGTLEALAAYWTPASLPGGAYLWQGINLLINLAVITVLFALIYRWLPDVEIAWEDVGVGALVTSVLFTLGKYLLSVYIVHSTVASSYGAAGSLAVVLLWVYYSAQIFLYGAAFTRVYATRHNGKRVQPTAIAEPSPAAQGAAAPTA